MSAFIRRFFSTSTNPTPAMEKTQKLITDNPVIVFSKSWCSYSSLAKQTLHSFDAEFKVYELDREKDGSEIQKALERLTGQGTVPNIFIAQKHIGGSDDLVYAARNSKQMLTTLRDAGALPGSSQATPKESEESKPANDL